MIPDDIKYIKAALQSLGVRNDSTGIKKGGAGPAEGDTIMLGDTAATVPINSKFVKDSPFTIVKTGSAFLLKKSGKEIMEVSYLPYPKFYSYKDQNGIPFWKIALRHGTDCLATTVVQKCMYWNTDDRCKFCGIELSLENELTIVKKTADQLALVAKKSNETDGLKHITLTSGTQSKPGMGIDHIYNCINTIKKHTDMPIHVQIEPGKDISVIDHLKISGADTIGIHIESFDMDILKKTAPVKAAYGLEKYIEFWKESVRVFGQNQVSSFLIAGLDEKDNSIIEGAKLLAGLGVYPYIIPLRPIPGSMFESSKPPGPEIMYKLYESVSQVLKSNQLKAADSNAGCVRCGACSAIMEFECN